MEPNVKGKIIYSVSVCSEEKFRYLFENSTDKPGQQVQKYHRLLLEGISSKKDINIDVVSKLPVTRHNFRKKYLKKEIEKVGNINYLYLPVINIPIIRNIYAFFCIIYYVLKGSNNKSVIIGDILNITMSIANLIVGKIKGIKTVGIVTDIPSFLAESSKSQPTFIGKLITRVTYNINEYILQKFDSYIFLTSQMNTLINKKNKPFVIMEGHVDVNMKLVDNTLENKYEKKICMYAGSLKNIYGIDMLTKAYVKADIDNSELHIYGSGDFENELIEICKKRQNIKYFGVKINDYVLKEQLKATLLINPRPINEEYTKYSFPSKNMEYMASGTPTLTTKLPGMPKEYNEFVYFIKDFTVDGISKILQEIMSKSSSELHEKGLRAKNFVLKEKNNIVQASKIIDMIKGMS